MTESPSYITICSEDEEGNVLLDIPEELLDTMGWGEGTVLDLDVIGDRLIIRKVVESTNSAEETP